jgi:hypothetical protein
MADLVSKNTVLYVTKEVTEGVAVNPTAGDQAVSFLTDSVEIAGNRETVERDNNQTSLVRELPRLGIRTCEASITTEVKANTTAGGLPECNLLLEAALGAVRSQSNTTTISATQTNTTSIKVPTGSTFVAGDIIMIKETNLGADGYHISPISAVADGGTNDDTLTLLVPTSTNYATTNSVIEKSTTFFDSNTEPSVTLTVYGEDAVKMQGAGCKVSSLSLDGFETAAIPSFAFALAGIDYDESLAASGLTATFDGATPPIVLSACVYKDGVKMDVTQFAFSVENTVSQRRSTCSVNGITGQRVTEKAITGSFTAYMDTTSVAQFTNFDAGTEFSLFMTLKNPGSSSGIWKEVIGVYMPRCMATAAPHTSVDGLMAYNVEFSAGKSSSFGASIYIGFI